MSIKSGRYFIVNAKILNQAYLPNENRREPVQSAYQLQNDPHVQWDVIDCKNGHHIIRNVQYPGKFAASASGPSSAVDEEIIGWDKDELWHIQKTKVQGQYTISTTDSKCFWGLTDIAQGTPIALAGVATDRRNWWMFREVEPGADAVLDQGFVSTTITPNVPPADLVDQTLLKALRDLIVPLIVRAVGQNEKSDIGQISLGPEAGKFISALQEFISSVVAGSRSSDQNTTEVGEVNVIHWSYLDTGEEDDSSSNEIWESLPEISESNAGDISWVGKSEYHGSYALETSEPLSLETMPAVAMEDSTFDLDTMNQTKMERSDCRLFALIIGINSYNKQSEGITSRSGVDLPAFTNLRGAVADAELFHKYLTSDLGVPEKQIMLLLDEKATRAEIIKAFQKLGDEDNEIRQGDSIAIFYAGRGMQGLPPKRLLTTKGCPEYIELLVPYDYNEISETQEYMGIPDYTLAALLDTIAKNKGDNITVIFDCCHSMPSSKELFANDDSQPITRGGPELNYNIPDDLDKEIWGGTKAMTVPQQLRYLGAASYVFFSACAPFELAKEEDGRGCFTSALLTLLQEMGSRTLSCSEIISRLTKIDGQSPQCEGLHVDRFIFHDFISSQKRRFFNVRPSAALGSGSGDPSQQYPEFILDAGSDSGLLQGDEFTVYPTPSDNDQHNPIGRLIIDKILPAQSRLRFCLESFDLPSNPAPVLLTKPAQRHLQLYIDVPNDETRRVNLESRIKKLNLHGTVFVTSELADRKKAHISLSESMVNNKAELRFDVIDADLTKTELDSCSHYLVDEEIEQEKLVGILENLAHYYWNLKRSSFGSSLAVDIAFYALEQHAKPPYFRPINEMDNLYKSTTRVDGVVDVQVDDDDEVDDAFIPSLYGLKLTNNTQWDLFPGVLYFDNTKFTILPIYHSLLSGVETEAPLKGGESMTIGYGTGAGAAVAPFTFSLPPDGISEGQNMEVSFLKIIISTEPIDPQGMVQRVPVFGTTRGLEQLVTPPLTPDPACASFTIKVVERLGGGSSAIAPSQ